MLDLAVVNGDVFIEGAFRKADIGIKDGKFALISEPGALPEAAKVIDAKGKHVLPGNIDTHMHIRDPGHAERGTFITESRAAAAGGCTTYFEQPISIPPQHNAKILHNRMNLAKAGSTVDYCFFGAAGGEYTQDIVPLSKEGVIAYKTFLHQAPEGRELEFDGLTSATNSQLMDVMKEVAKTGICLAAHAEDNELITGNIAKLRAEGRTDYIAHCESRPPITEIEAIAKMLRFGEETGCPIELVHVSTCGAMELAKQAKLKGQKVFVETCPHYLLLTEEDVKKFGPYAKCNPALRSLEEVQGLWKYVLDGTVDFIGSDHSPFLVEEKERGKSDIFKATSGFPGVDLRLPLMVNEAQKGRISLEKVVELLSVNPAKCFNIFPQKGTISAGADADLAIIDLNKETTVDWHKNYSHAKEIAKVYDGWKLACSVDYTLVRGRVVMENGVVDESASGWGEFVRPVSK